MSWVKARWRSYERLRALLAALPSRAEQFEVANFRPELIGICQDLKLDHKRVAEISGVPVQAAHMLVAPNADLRDFQPNSANQKQRDWSLSLFFDTRKLINGLLAYIGPSEAELAELGSSKTDAKQALVALGLQARDFLSLSSSSVSQLEAELCNLTKTNQIEVLAEIAFAMARLRDQLPTAGLRHHDETEALRREIVALQVRVDALRAERDRLSDLVDKLTNQPAPIKSAFLQSVGSLPLMAASGAVGMLCGPEQAQVMISYVQALVAVTQGGS